MRQPLACPCYVKNKGYSLGPVDSHLAATLEDTAAGIGVLVAIRNNFAEVAAVSYEQTRRQLASG